MTVANIDKGVEEGLFEEAAFKLRIEWAGAAIGSKIKPTVQAGGTVDVKTLQQERAW